MNLAFNGGRFVSQQGELNYQEVLDDIRNASKIRIMTYNISAKDNPDALLEQLNEAKDNAEIKIITNIPSRFPNYFHSKTGEHMKNKAHKTLKPTYES